MIINSCTDFITISYSAISVFVADAVDVATDVVVVDVTFADAVDVATDVVVDVTFSYIWNSRCCCNNKPEKRNEKSIKKLFLFMHIQVGVYMYLVYLSLLLSTGGPRYPRSLYLRI